MPLWKSWVLGNLGLQSCRRSLLHRVRFAPEGEVGSKSDVNRITFGDLLRLAEQGDAKAQRALVQTAEQLGAGLAMLISGLAPDILVVIGEITRAWPRIGGVVEVALKNAPSLMRLPASCPPILTCSPG